MVVTKSFFTERHASSVIARCEYGGARHVGAAQPAINQQVPTNRTDLFGLSVHECEASTRWPLELLQRVGDKSAWIAAPRRCSHNRSRLPGVWSGTMIGVVADYSHHHR